EPHKKIVYERNESYWGQKPKTKRIVYEEIGDADARVIAALSGRYHIVLNIPVASKAQFDTSNTSQIVSVPAANTHTIYLNLKKPGLDDPKVRQALAWGVDREELNLLGEEGLSTPVTVWIASNPFYSDFKNMFFDSYNAQKAEELLDGAGWKKAKDGYRYKDSKPLEIVLRTFRTDKAMGEALQIQWDRLGVKVAVRHGDYSLIQDARKTGDWGASIEAWSTFGNVVPMLEGQYSPRGAGNYGGYADDRTNELIGMIANVSDSGERKALVEELSLHIAEESPAIYICPRAQLTAVSTSLEGFVPHFRQFENLVNADMRLKGQ
ncbi:MAG TPA: ABC transporter substrate-binding protein, partial [Syntrophorhabdus aromaticivorans]|nr:ABC transporter substrate-binding protein [Syntrophorhabdus aromaticivorans]